MKFEENFLNDQTKKHGIKWFPKLSPKISSSLESSRKIKHGNVIKADTCSDCYPSLRDTWLIWHLWKWKWREKSFEIEMRKLKRVWGKIMFFLQLNQVLIKMFWSCKWDDLHQLNRSKEKIHSNFILNSFPSNFQEDFPHKF